MAFDPSRLKPIEQGAGGFDPSRLVPINQNKPTEPKKGILSTLGGYAADIGEFATDPGLQMDAYKDLGIGAAKGLASTAAHASKLGEKLFQKLGAKKVGDEYATDTFEKEITPENRVQEVGFAIEQIAEFFVPGAASANLEKALMLGAKARLPVQIIAGSGKLAKFGRAATGAAGILTRASAEGGLAYGQRLLQTADKKEAESAAKWGFGVTAGVGLAGVAANSALGIGKTVAEKQAEGTKLMRDVLGNQKSLSNFAKKRKINLDKISTFLAEEGATPTVVDGKLNWDEAIKKFGDEVGEVGMALDNELSQTPRTVSWSWKKPLQSVLTKIDDITDNAAEALQARKYAKELIAAEKLRYGRNPSMQSVNRARAGMWKVGYEHGVPGSALKAKVGRLLGHEIGDLMKATELTGNAKSALARMSELSRAVSVLEKTAGQAVKGGRLEKYFARTIGAGIGTTAGSVGGAVLGPVGAAAGAVLGGAAGGAVGEVIQNKFMKDSVVKAAEKAAKLFQSADEPTKLLLIRKYPVLRTIFDRLLGKEAKVRLNLKANPMAGAAFADEAFAFADDAAKMVGKVDDFADDAASVDDYLYHGTSREKLKKIAERGLLSGNGYHGRGLYAADSVAGAEKYAKDNTGGLVLRFKKTEEFKPHVFGRLGEGIEGEFKGDPRYGIKSDDLEVLTKDGWQKLKQFLEKAEARAVAAPKAGDLASEARRFVEIRDTPRFRDDKALSDEFDAFRNKLKDANRNLLPDVAKIEKAPAGGSPRSAALLDEFGGVYRPGADIITFKDGTRILSDLDMSGGSFELSQFGVSKNNRGGGVGTKYIQWLKDLAETSKTRLDVHKISGASEGFWDKMFPGQERIGGRLGSVTVDPFATKAKGKSLPLSDIAESAKSGGFTYDPKTNLVYKAGEGILGDTGIMVSAYPERTRKILADSPDALRDNPEVINQFRQALTDNADLLSKGKHKLGGRYSDKDKAFVLDVAVRVPEEFADDAVEIARVADQEGGFKVSNAEYIPYGGSGGAKAQGTFGERAAMVEEKMKKWSNYDSSRKGMVRLKKPEEIPSAKNLTSKDLKIEARAKKMAIEKQDEIVADYRKNNPNIVNSDDYRDYFEKVGYNGSNSNAIHESVSYLANRDFAERVLDPRGAKNVILLAGGPGSGKSATLGKVPEIASSMEGGAIIWDGVLGSANSMKEKIGLVRKGKKSPIITVVIRNPYAAHQSTIDRFLSMKKKKGFGRVVPTRITAEGLLGAKIAGEAVDALGGKVRWISNLGDAKDVHLASFDEIAREYPKASQEELKKAFDKATMERADLAPEEKAAFTESVLTKE